MRKKFLGCALATALSVLGLVGCGAELGLEDPNELEEQGKWDINAFEEMAGKIKDAGKIALVLDNNQESNICWFRSSGATMYDENGKCIINSPESVAIYTKMQNMIKDGKVQWNGNSKIDANGLFMGQQLAFVEAGRWLMPLFKDIKDFEFDIYRQGLEFRQRLRENDGCF